MRGDPLASTRISDTSLRLMREGAQAWLDPMKRATSSKFPSAFVLSQWIVDLLDDRPEMGQEELFDEEVS